MSRSARRPGSLRKAARRGFAVFALLAANQAEAQGGAAPLGLKTAPPDAAVYIDGRRLVLTEGPNGSRRAQTSPGSHELLLLADGHIAEKRRIEVPPQGCRVEAKLERAGGFLRFAGMAATGARPKSVYYSPDGRRLFVPLLSGQGVEVLDAATLEKLGELVPPSAYARAEGFVECAFFPKRGEVWVSQMHLSLIHAFDLASLAYKDSFSSGGSYPKVIAPSADGRLAFVTNWVSEDLCVLETDSRRVVARVPLGGIGRGLAASPDGKRLYVALFEGGAILEFSLPGFERRFLLPPDGGAKRHLVLDPARRRLYATDMDRGSLFVVSLASDRLIAELPLGDNPNGCALSPDGALVVACTRGPNGAAGYELPGPRFGELVVVDANLLAVIDRRWGGNQPTGLAVAPDGRRLVFTDFLDHRVEAYDIECAPRPFLPRRIRGEIE